MTLRFQLLVGEGSMERLRAAATKLGTLEALCACCSCRAAAGEPGSAGLPASGNACRMEGRASGPWATARGQDIVEVKGVWATAFLTEALTKSSPLELFGMMFGPPCAPHAYYEQHGHL